MELAQKVNCTGCTACVSSCEFGAISMVPDREGFLYPKIDAEKCIECGKCVKACPAIYIDAKYGQIPERVYAGWNCNENERYYSSSGGAFILFAKEIILHRNGVVYGAVYEKNQVVHKRIDSVEDLRLLQGSKYVQSDLRGIYGAIKKDIKDHKNVLFSGTPCQVEGLYKYLGDYRNKGLYTIDVVCHGVPSPLVWAKYVIKMEKEYGSKILNVRFRSKKYGWRCQGTEIWFENGKIVTKDLFHDFFFRGFLRNYILRPSCHNCQYASEYRVGDITLADFWGYSDERGRELDDDKGISAIMVNTVEGIELLKNCEQQIVLQEKELVDVSNYQRTMHASFPEAGDRQEFWLDMDKYGFDYVCNKYLYPDKDAVWKLFKISKVGRLLIEFKKMLIRNESKGKDGER